MLYPIKIVDIELSRPLTTFEGLDGYIALQGLVRLHGAPIGYIKAPITNGRCTATTISRLILEEHSWNIINRLLQNGLAAPPRPEGLRLEDLFDVPPPEYNGTWPLVTVAVCTRDRTSDLSLCLDALNRLDYPYLDILVVDNAPTSNATEMLVRNHYPNVRYTCEPRPGLDWARNRAIIESKGEILAYTDDDVIVDSGWVKGLAQVFAENPEVMAVTGLVVPYELETESQVLFEMYGGFGRGFERKWHRVSPDNKMPWQWLGAGQFGTGANMAYRRCVFDEIGYFDPALDVGTVTNGGGDLEMYFRVLKEGHTLIYEPNAMVRHRHRRDYEKLKTQLTNNGTGLLCYLNRTVQAYPHEWGSFLQLMRWWLQYWIFGRLFLSFFRPTRFPRELIFTEFQGSLITWGRYKKARRNAIEIAAKFGSATDVEVDRPKQREIRIIPKRQDAVAVRTIDLSQPLKPLTDVADYSKVRVFVTWNNQPLGTVDIPNPEASISKSHLIEAVVQWLGVNLLEPNRQLSQEDRYSLVNATLWQHYTPRPEANPSPLPTDVSVSVVVATYDRPDDLRNCLRCLVAQESPRSVEIIIVDNHPASGVTPPVVAEFPGVVLVSETRQGLSYARNAGIVASKGDIIVSTDDDVTVPPDWLEKLVAPFSRTDVMVVTGNVWPVELETSSQQFFESYGGLGRGLNAFEVNGDWFESFKFGAVPTWNLGACANAAFRTSIFSHPEIGLIDEALGAGTPTGCSEDTYVFYKVLKLGYTLVYEPTAYVWHKHRTDMKALRRQLYNYSKGHVAYHLTTWLGDGDWRGLFRILVELPLAHAYRIKERFMRRSDYSIPLVLQEIAGNLAGPWALWKSRQMVKRNGCSNPYIPVQQRSVAMPESLSVEKNQYLTIGNSQQSSKEVKTYGI